MKIAFRNSKPHQQFGINAFSNIAVYVINLGIGMWFTPFLIKNLGVDSYGLIPLANSVTTYLIIIPLSLNGAVGRFLTIDLQKDDIEGANQTFNTSFFGSLLLTIGSLPFLLGFVYLIPLVFNIPTGTENAAKLLFFFVMFSFLVTTVESCFSVSSWAKNRFDLRNIVVVFSNLARISIVVVLFKLTQPSVWQVGLGILLAGLIGLAGDIFIWKQLTPELRISKSHFNLTKIRELFSMGGWITTNQIGSLLFLNIDLIVANLALGTKIAGEYGTILLFSTLLRSLSGTVSGILNPIVVAKYAIKDFPSITRLSKQSVRLMGLAIGLAVGLLCGLGGPFLKLWLGNDFDSLWLLLILIIFHLPINLAVMPLFGIQQALNKVKIPGILTLVLGIGNLLLALLFTLVFKWGSFGLAAAGAIVLTLKNVIFTPIYGAHIQKLPWYTYIGAVVPGLIMTSLVLLLSYGSTVLIQIDSWVRLIFTGIIIAMFVIGGLFLFGLKREDKDLILGFVPSFRRS
jgi:membrane protein EpsK